MDLNDDDEDAPKTYDFGWWPEIAGALGTAALIASLMIFARGLL